MRTPRNISGQDLLKLLKKNFGYEVTRQVGSHIRITTKLNGEHHLTIPNHFPVRIGTLNKIITLVAIHLQIDKDEVFETLFRE